MSPVRQRVHNLRRRAIAASVALFIALFSGIGIQLASGHDPALQASSAVSTPATSRSSTTTSSTSTPATSKSSASTSSSTASPTSRQTTQTLPPVTTSQS